MKLKRETRQIGILSSVFGSISMVAWLIPVVGLISSLTAILVGVYAYENPEDGFAIVGVSLGALGLILTVLRSGLVYFYG